MKDHFWSTISFVKGIGSKRLIHLYEQYPHMNFNNIDDILQTITRKHIHRLLTSENIERARDHAEKLKKEHEKKQIKMIPISSESYPVQLRLIPDPPTMLYAKGNIDLLQEENHLAIVGTRKPTTMGLASAKKIAKTFADKGYTIVSGLALGIDTAAHQGALQAKYSKTIAVLAGDLTNIYPACNRQLAHNILENGGLWLSEIPIGQPSTRGNFVKRDRIQSGLSLAVCPVQTPIQSGTQHTIEYSRKQNRFLFTPIPMDEDLEENAVQGNLQLIDSGVFVLKNKNSYAIIQEKMNDIKKILELEYEQRFT